MGMDLREIARFFHVHRRTVDYWVHDPLFQACYEEAKARVHEELWAGLRGLAQSSIQVLRSILAEGSESARLKAALEVLDRLGVKSTDEHRITARGQYTVNVHLEVVTPEYPASLPEGN
jgi:hypothetical protein